MKTLIIIRPHAVKRGLMGEILGRFERHGIVFTGLKLHKLTREEAETLYESHQKAVFYESLIESMVVGPSLIGVLHLDIPDDESAIKLVRKIVGETDPAKAEMGTIRGDYGLRIDQNIIHASDSKAQAEREIPLFFREDELAEVTSTIKKIV